MTYQLQPFNQTRFDAAMAWVAKSFDRTISQYEAVKIHALADVLHVVRFHNPIIGGTLKKLPYGPVALDALNRVKAWKDDRHAPFEFVDKIGNTMLFKRKAGPTRESMFTPSAQHAIKDAASIVFAMDFAESQKFFHGQIHKANDFLGKAWGKTRSDKAPISWESIIDAYVAQTGENSATLKSLIGI